MTLRLEQRMKLKEIRARLEKNQLTEKQRNGVLQKLVNNLCPLSRKTFIECQKSDIQNEEYILGQNENLVHLIDLELSLVGETVRKVLKLSELTLETDII